jgi:hypothetical protein
VVLEVEARLTEVEEATVDGEGNADATVDGEDAAGAQALATANASSPAPTRIANQDRDQFICQSIAYGEDGGRRAATRAAPGALAQPPRHGR